MLNDNFTTNNNTRSLNSCMFFSGVYSLDLPGLFPTASSFSTQVFSRGIYMDRLFFPFPFLRYLINIPSGV